MGFDTIPVTVTASAVDGGDAVLVGDLVAFSSAGISPALINAAADAYALALILASKILPNWPLTMTVDVAADAQGLNTLVQALGDHKTPRLWTLDFGGGITGAFQAVTSDDYAVSATGDVVRYAIELSPVTTCELSGGDIVTTTFDLRSPFNFWNNLLYGVL